MRQTWFPIALLAVVVGIIPSVAESAPVSVLCPDTSSTTDREFTLTTDPIGATCLLSGNDANDLNANSSDVMFLAGWTIIDKDQADPDAVFPNDAWFSVTGIGATSGSFIIDPTAWSSFGRLAIGLVVGGGTLDPKYVVFELPFNETTGTWSDQPPQGGGLSHTVLYGIPATSQVPEPASLLLLGSGLFGAVKVRSRRKSTQA